MSRCTQGEALRRFRHLADADAGRLVGRRLIDLCTPVEPGTLATAPARLLHDSVYRTPGVPPERHMICYVVSADGTPVAWVDYHAHVTAPDAELTDYQRAQQAKAVAVLSSLDRRAIRELAALRDVREQRLTPQAPTARDTDTRVLVSCPTDPTLTFWTRLTAHPNSSRAHLRAVADTQLQPLIVDAFGYGDHGRDRRVLDLELLCAIEASAVEHTLPASVIGDWLHVEGATSADLTAQQIRTAVTAAYVATFTSKVAFARHERDVLGWTALFREHHIPLEAFDDRVHATLLFQDTVRAVFTPAGQIAVFRRARPDPPVA
ncbi:hypothetical protein AB0M43_34940 [Longispora sp. NPDC051575]|uniref:hypothetical protein n=1 Tax=Longispora sp. NPDC051575 TaxID=3154943 RepID=UPI0034338166